MPLIWANENARNAHLTRENAKAWEERHQAAVQPPGETARPMMPARPVQAATGQPGAAGAGSQGHAGHAVPGGAGNAGQGDTPILDSDGAFAAVDAFSATRQRKGRVRARSSQAGVIRGPDANENHSQLDFGPLADPQLEQIAQRAANVEDQKQLWRDLIKALKKLFPADQANQARERIWARRKAIRAERGMVARARKQNGTA